MSPTELTAAPCSRRAALGWFGATASLVALSGCGQVAQARDFPVSLTADQWRDRLSAQEFRVLREAATERPHSSPLNEEKRAGVYRCAGCGNALYSSKTKFESGTGWPSFWMALSGGVATARDFKLGYPRTEVHCADCGGHLGHVFNDGPRPTGKRHCINGLALDFQPA